MRPELDDTLSAASPAPSPAPDAALDRTATHVPAPRVAPGAGPPTLATGQQLGHFRIERRIGAGGMGEVYLATDLALDRPVAIKVLPDALSREPRLRERLIREARAQARVVHPNVGHIYFIGEDAGRLYFAMEHVVGETLAERVARAPLTTDDALAAIRGAVLGLREAQRHGFTHRDVKPSNLMVDAHGVLKVLDFGLAAGAAPGDAATATTDTPVAQTSFAGTPLYMAPEQARGEPIDFRADIYALGVTLFHLVAGHPPFVADTVGELVSLHASAERPAIRRRGLPRAQLGAIEALCARMMAARPADRFASYDELLRAIEVASPRYTRPAGFWARAIATSIDLAIVTSVTALALVVAGLLGAGEREETAAVLLVLLLYDALATARWGTTAGKAVFELEVADLTTLERPSLRRALRRALLRLGPATALLWAADALEAAGLRMIAKVVKLAWIALAAVWIALLLYAALRGGTKRALWDRASGTLVRYRTDRHGPFRT